MKPFDYNKYLHNNPLLKEEKIEEGDVDGEYVPYQFDDDRGKFLYLKYDKAFENPAWKRGKFPMSKLIDLSTLLKITGLTLPELEELNTYRDESWSLDIDKEEGIVTEFTD